MASERQPYSGQTCTMEDADFVLLWIKGNGTLKSANLCRLELCHSLQNRGQWCGSHTLSPPVMWPSGSKHWGSSFSDTTQRNNEGESFEKYLSMASTEWSEHYKQTFHSCLFSEKAKTGRRQRKSRQRMHWVWKRHNCLLSSSNHQQDRKLSEKKQKQDEAKLSFNHKLSRLY